MASTTQNLTGAEMMALWLQYQADANAFEAAIRIKDDGTPETMAAFEQARQSVMEAHTIDLTGIAIKLAVLSESDCGDEVTGIVRDLAAAGIVTPRVVG